MKNRCMIHYALAAVLLAGCATPPEKKPLLQRGWIGGRYERAQNGRTLSQCLFGVDHTLFCFPPALGKSRNAGILALSLGTNTPAYLAGLREGDLILELGHQPVTSLPDFWRIVTGSQPGASLPAKVFREGQTMEYNVTVGREKYRLEGNFTVALPGFLEPPHLVPTRDAPWFSLGPLGYEKNDDAPAEFDSVKERFKQSCRPKDKQQTAYDEDSRWWLAIMRVKYGKRILAQELVTPTP